MGKYYEAVKETIVANGVTYTLSGTVTRGLYTAEDTLPEGAKIGDRKRILILFRKGHKGGAFRSYDLTKAEVNEFIAENCMISSDEWKARAKTTDSKAPTKMVAGDIDLEPIVEETEVDGEGLADEPVESETVQEEAVEVNTKDKFLRNEKGHICGKNPNYIAPETVQEAATA